MALPPPIEDTKLGAQALAYVIELYRELTSENGAPHGGTSENCRRRSFSFYLPGQISQGKAGGSLPTGGREPQRGGRT
jgi:hypothetical protein